MKTITIIGAGLGGLTAGALLSKRGFKVTLLEQHNIVGGCATTFKRKGGFICEVGLHEMDSAFSGEKREIFETLGVYDHVEFVRVGEFFRVKSDSIDFTMPESKEEVIKALTLAYPDEKEAIENYFKLIATITDEFNKLSNASWWQYLLFPFIFKNIIKYRKNSITEVMDEIFKDEEIKLILNANIGYYTDKIKNGSFLLHSLAQNSYYSGGGWFIKGGSQKLSDYLASVIVKNGGEVIVKANVIKIDEKKVTYEYKKELLEIDSDIIISNLSPKSTYKLANIPYKESLEISPSLISIYIGFKENLKSIYGKQAYSTFVFDGINSICNYDLMMDKNVKDRGFVFVDYSQIDSNLTKDEGKSFGVITTTDYLSNWKDFPKEEYKKQKEIVLQSFLDKLEQHYPNIKKHIEFAEVATPKTVQRYIKTSNDTAYGFAPTPKQFFRIPQIKSKKMKNLYFVGAWVMGGGFTPAITSGKMCATEIGKKI